MITLQKTKNTEWNGNGLGSNTAEWAVKGQEHISVRQLGGKWWAIDTSEYAIFKGRKVCKKITSSWDKKTLIEKLETKI